MLSKSANPYVATPSQAPRGEGVEIGWEPPDRVTAKVKAQSRPRTLGERAAVKAEVAWDQESPGSSPGGAIRSAVGRSSHRALCFGGRCVPAWYVVRGFLRCSARRGPDKVTPPPATPHYAPRP